jgi:hypothetical protein
MTFCFGFRTAAAAFVLGDTAVTRYDTREFRTGDYSSFLEPHVSTHSHVIEEAALKVACFGSKIIACAGSGAMATEATLLVQANCDQPTSEILHILQRSLLPSADSVEIIVAEWGPSGPTLSAWTSSTLEVTSGDFVGIGRVPAPLHEALFKIGDLLQRFPFTSIEVLSMVQGCYQSLVLRNATMQAHVGGAVIGAYADASATHWQPDTIFGVYDPNEIVDPFADACFLPSINFVHVLVRDRIAMLAPVMINGRLGTKVLAGPELDRPGIEAHINGCRAEVSELIQKHEPRHWVFLSRRSGLVAVIPNDGAASERGVQFDGDVGYAIDKQVLASLRFWPVPEGADQLAVFVARPSGQGGLTATIPMETWMHDAQTK